MKPSNDWGSQKKNDPQSNSNKKRDHDSGHTTNVPVNRGAQSPYNFVPLNENVVYPPKEEQSVFFDRFDEKRNTGFLDVEVENMTFLMISRGAKEEYPNRIHDFLKVGIDQKIIIPGSSFRGLIRKTVGIISSSRLIQNEHYSDHPLFFRDVAGRKVKQVYQNAFLNLDDYNDYKPRAGYLERFGNEYKITPAKTDNYAVQYYKIRVTSPVSFDRSKNTAIFKFGNKAFSDYSFKEKIFFIPQPKKEHFHNSVHGKLKYALVNEFNFTEFPGAMQGYLIITGGFQTKKHDQWIMNLKDDIKSPITLKQEIIEEYRQDKNRSENYNVLDELKKSYSIPVFYLVDNQEQIISFGHTPLFRIKHKKSIVEAVVQHYKESSPDFEQLIFGQLDVPASRVYFEDLLIQNENSQINPTLIKILAEPKPTSGELYLKQDGDILVNWSSNEGIKIAGTKEYWHKNTGSDLWEDKKEKETKSHSGYLKALKPHSKFKGRIRFENLTDKELGALLFALDLGEGYCHKIGMGKPYGLGTINVSVKLHMDERKLRYKKMLSNEGGWNLPSNERELEDFKCIFEKYMLSTFGSSPEIKSIWETERLKQYSAMLKYDEKLHGSTKWLEQTRYMEIQREKKDTGESYEDQYGSPKPHNEFGDRKTLASPVSILKKIKDGLPY
ncbi:MAG: TIGR03986 family CRISPR-associated RAMP protein [Bacteroidales bacterium]|nr:TIGR03986 family CRISPR-associated RAMP protein [Bacteroidales bacterium]